MTVCIAVDKIFVVCLLNIRANKWAVRIWNARRASTIAEWHLWIVVEEIQAHLFTSAFTSLYKRCLVTYG